VVASTPSDNSEAGDAAGSDQCLITASSAQQKKLRKKDALARQALLACLKLASEELTKVIN
jgi:hypothetical protein